MRIWKVALALALSGPAFYAISAGAQTVSGTAAGNRITQTNGMFVGQMPNAVTPQNVNPNLGASQARPPVAHPGFSPAMPNPGNPAITPQGIAPAIAPRRTVNTAIGQQGFGGAIGRQGSGTAIGQQGSGTAIGQQGAGTAIIPTNGVVIGQPQPLSPPPVSTPSGIGFSTNMPNALGSGFTNRGTILTNGAPHSGIAPFRSLNRPTAVGRR